MNSTTCYIEITQESLKARYEGRALELPLQRLPDGRLEPGCKQTVTSELQKFAHKSMLQSRMRITCAIDARGLSLRRFKLPATGHEDRRRLLSLQIESEFPLAPSELAWGFQKVTGTAAATNHEEDVLVAAIRATALQDYMDVLGFTGAKPCFVPAALARLAAHPKISRSSGHLHIGRKSSELLALENGTPSDIRVLGWGASDLSGAAQPQPAPVSGGAGLTPTAVSQIDGTIRAVSEVGQIANPATRISRIGEPRAGEEIYVSGLPSSGADLTGFLTQQLGVACEALQGADDSDSMAIAGLMKADTGERPLLTLDLPGEPKKRMASFAGKASRKLVASAALLVLLAALFPYLEALIRKPMLARQLAALKADRGRLEVIDRELEFLRYLKQNQPPYLDTLYMISKSIPPGARFDSVSLNRRGDLSLRGSMKDANQVAEFRSKLLDTGLFSNLALEEQTPTADRQKLTIRMSAQWKQANARAVATQAAAKEPEKPKGSSSASGMGMPSDMPGAPGPMAMPGGMPMGIQTALPPGMRPRSMPKPGPIPPGAIPPP